MQTFYRSKSSWIIAAAAAACALSGGAALVPLSPAGGEKFEILPEAQRLVLSGETRERRSETIRHIRHAIKGKEIPASEPLATEINALDKNAAKDAWRKSAPLVFKWKATENEKGPWLVRLALKEDLSDARNFWFEDKETQKSGETPDVVWSYTAPLANLEPGAKYFWQVWSRIKCSEWTCSYTYPDHCPCGATKAGVKSPVAQFETSASVPRWIEIEGRTKNIRDLGGWKTADGRTVRRGLLYRGQGLNDNSLAGIDKGRNRLMVEDADYLKNTLGIKTDLDLRSPREVAGLDGVSPLGDGVKFIHVSSESYQSIFNKKGKKAMRKCFAVVSDAGNMPIYFHCIGGADRTGSLAYVLNGLLGVGKEDLERDWESTFYDRLKIPGVENPDDWRSSKYFDDGFAKYGGEGDPLQTRIELYLEDCGVTKEEIAAFRKTMLGGE